MRIYRPPPPSEAVEEEPRARTASENKSGACTCLLNITPRRTPYEPNARAEIDTERHGAAAQQETARAEADSGLRFQILVARVRVRRDRGDQ